MKFYILYFLISLVLTAKGKEVYSVRFFTSDDCSEKSHVAQMVSNEGEVGPGNDDAFGDLPLDTCVDFDEIADEDDQEEEDGDLPWQGSNEKLYVIIEVYDVDTYKPDEILSKSYQGEYITFNNYPESENEDDDTVTCNTDDIVTSMRFSTDVCTPEEGEDGEDDVSFAYGCNEKGKNMSINIHGGLECAGEPVFQLFSPFKCENGQRLRETSLQRDEEKKRKMNDVVSSMNKVVNKVLSKFGLGQRRITSRQSYFDLFPNIDFDCGKGKVGKGGASGGKGGASSLFPNVVIASVLGMIVLMMN